MSVDPKEAKKQHEGNSDSAKHGRSARMLDTQRTVLI